MLLSMAESFVQKMNEKDGIPSIQSAWEHITENQVLAALEQAKEIYQEALATCLRDDQPLSYEVLFEYLREARDLSLERMGKASGLRDRSSLVYRQREK